MTLFPPHLYRPVATLAIAAAIVLAIGTFAQSVFSHRTDMMAQTPFTSVEHVMVTPKLAVMAQRAQSAPRNAAAPIQNAGTLPQIARVGAITMVVPNVDRAVSTVSLLARRQNGDVLSLDDKADAESGSHPSALIEIRVPERRFETTLDVLATVGTTQARSIAAEDVSSQLVDSSARLRNARRTESDIQRLMDRSGSVTEVLAAENQLSSVRESVETLDADIAALRTRVRYSTISVTIQAEAAANPAEPGVNVQLRAAWAGALRSVEQFTIGIIANGLWLIAFAPYFLLVAFVIWILRARMTSPKPR